MIFERLAAAISVLASSFTRFDAQDVVDRSASWFMTKGRPVVFVVAASVVLIVLAAACFDDGDLLTFATYK